METFGVDFSFFPVFKLIIGISILVLACFVAILPLLSRNPRIKFIKRSFLLVLLIAIVYLNIHSYSSSPYMFLMAEIVVLIVCYRLYTTLIKRVISNERDESYEGDASRYLNEIKRKNSGS